MSYVYEKESDTILKALERSDQVFASELGMAELAVVFHRKYREGQLDKSITMRLASNLNQITRTSIGIGFLSLGRLLMV